MRIGDLNWMQLEEYLKHDDRCVLPLGCTEQHAYLSLATDSILAERIAVEAAEPLGIPVFPVFSYGITPTFKAFPGSISLRIETYLRVIGDILDGLSAHGFRRIAIVNGHGGNAPAQPSSVEWMADHPRTAVKFHNWWIGPRTWAKVTEIDPVASHASWMENFPWTRLADVAMPAEQKPRIDDTHLRRLPPDAAREYLGDGNFGGFYQRPDKELLALWQVAIEETRDFLSQDW
ncbi:MAG: creatininase family protein [Anaerolineae bacterium]|nr:creatininase family protein [Anaerolineae bacterium]